MNRLEVREQILCCEGCDLFRQQPSTPTPFSGPTPAEVMVLGEAPGGEEAQQGQPFIGPAGSLLRRTLTQVGFDVANLVFANTVCCNPGRAPTAGEVNACSTNRSGQLEVADPTWVLAVGGVALSAIRPDLKVMKARRHIFRHDGRWWFSAVHPSWALRNGGQGEKELLADLGLFFRMVATHDPMLSSCDCVRCGVDGERMGESGRWLLFEDDHASWCNACWELSPSARAEAREDGKAERKRTRTGEMFPA